MANLKNIIVNDTGFVQYPTGTTAQRPVSPSEGAIRYNSTINVAEFYNGTSWVAIDGKVRATQSGAQDESNLSATHTIFTYLGSGSFTATTAGIIDYLIVAGGGSGGYYVGGGGGAGGYLEGSVYVPSGSYLITVGSGGSGATNRPPTSANAGGDSAIQSITGLTAIGGGGGGSYNGYDGADGGSAGGQGGPHVSETGFRRVPTTGQGSPGGRFLANRSGSPTNGSGGGGAGAAGGDELGAGYTGDGAQLSGGDGLQSWVCPYNYYYAGGGGGGAYNSSSPCQAGDGGLGGGAGGTTSSNANTSRPGLGGQGGFSRNPGANGSGGDPVDGGSGGANTGGGGGGAGHFSSGDNGTGGSGIVIIRFRK
jgi:hypothetical protein